MSQRVVLAVQVLLVAVGVGLFISGPIGREAAASGLALATAAAEGVPANPADMEAFRAAGALLMGAGLFGLSYRYKSVR